MPESLVREEMSFMFDLWSTETCERGAANYLSDKHQQFFKSNQAQAVNSPFTDYVSLKIT